MTPTIERLLRRLVAAVLVAAVTLVATTQLDLEPEPVRVVLLCLLVVAVAGLAVDGLPRSVVIWYPVPTHPPISEGRDEATQSHLRSLENHQLSRHPDAALRDRLAVLAEQVLFVRHGVHVHTEQGRELLGPELVALLQGPVVRLNPRRAAQVLTLIEEL